MIFDFSKKSVLKILFGTALVLLIANIVLNNIVVFVLLPSMFHGNGISLILSRITERRCSPLS